MKDQLLGAAHVFPHHLLQSSTILVASTKICCSIFKSVLVWGVQNWPQDSVSACPSVEQREKITCPSIC